MTTIYSDRPSHSMRSSSTSATYLNLPITRRRLLTTIFLAMCVGSHLLLPKFSIQHMNYMTRQTSTATIDSSSNDHHPFHPWDHGIRHSPTAESETTSSQNEYDEETNNDQTIPQQQPLDEYDEHYSNFHTQPLNILALGGSVTWGGAIVNRYDAFPFLLANIHPQSRIDNLAIRATGAAYPAACIQSMMEGDGGFPEYDVYPGSSSTTPDTIDGGSDGEEHDEISRSIIAYDIILLEFSINGIGSTEVLVSRLRQRYPHSLIVYVHLESVSHPSAEFITEEYIQSLMEPVGGLYFYFPSIDRYEATLPTSADGINDAVLPSYDKLFMQDMHHLSEIGHKFVAHEIVKLVHDHYHSQVSQRGGEGGEEEIKNIHLRFPSASTSRNLYSPTTDMTGDNQEEENFEESLLGTWGGGDQCYMWLSSWGYFPKSIHVKEESGRNKENDEDEPTSQFRIFDKLKKKYSYEIEYGANLTLSFERNYFDGSVVPIHLVYMTLGDPPKYPDALVTLRSRESVEQKYDDNDEKGDLIKSTHVIDPMNDPLFPEWSWAHLTHPEVVGNTHPGRVELTIQPLSETENPFRLVGIIICGACVETNSRMSASNIRVRVPL